MAEVVLGMGDDRKRSDAAVKPAVTFEVMLLAETAAGAGQKSVGIGDHSVSTVAACDAAMLKAEEIVPPVTLTEAP